MYTLIGLHEMPALIIALSPNDPLAAKMKLCMGEQSFVYHKSS